jgi:hypothetical protein
MKLLKINQKTLNVAKIQKRKMAINKPINRGNSLNHSGKLCSDVLRWSLKVS